MKAEKIITIALIGLVLSLVGTSSAETFTVELPELIGDLQPYPNGSSASFDFGTTFLQIDQVSIRIKGTNTPFLFPEINAYMDPGVGSCYTFLNPLESPFDIEKQFLLRYGASWDFLLDGKGIVNADLIWPISGGQAIETPSTVEISEAYLTIEGVIPEPSTLCFLLMGSFWITYKPLRKMA